MWSKRRQTADGIEASFALNHLSPTVLTEMLLGVLQAGRPSRIVDVTSSSIQAALLAGGPSYDDVEAGEYYGMAATGRAKLAHLAYTLELAGHLRGAGVSVFAADPGAAATPNAAEMTPEILPLALRSRWEYIHRGLQDPAAHPAAEAARSVVFAATDPSLDGDTGLVIDPRCSPSDALTPELIAAAHALTERTLKTIRPPGAPE